MPGLEKGHFSNIRQDQYSQVEDLIPDDGRGRWRDIPGSTSVTSSRAEVAQMLRHTIAEAAVVIDEEIDEEIDNLRPRFTRSFLRGMVS